MLIKQKIKNLIKEAVSETNRNIEILEPENKAHGDYATNLALKTENPEKEAKKIKKEIENFSETENIIKKVEIAGGGFINFSLNRKFLYEQLTQILKKGSNFGNLDVGNDRKINVEFISINPTGKLHVGHARGAFFGDALTRILKKAGYNTKSEYYVNNAKTSKQIRELGKTCLGEGKQYDTTYLRNLISEHKETLKGFQEPSKAGQYMAGVIMEEIKEFVEDELRISFDRYFEEQTLHNENKINGTLQKLREKDLVYIKEGALWLKTSKFGDDEDQVIIRKDGKAGYFLPDIAYHLNKKERGFEKLIDIWGADHQGHKKRMKAAAKIFGYEDDLEILINQMVSLKAKDGSSKQLSKRKGTAVNFDEFVKEVGVDAARFIILSKDLSTHMSFNMEIAKKESKQNPVYYVQYAGVRSLSLFEESKFNFEKFKLKTDKLNYLKTNSELQLIKKLIKFPDLIKDIAQSREVHHLPTYLHELATAFNNFYEKNQVLIEGDKNTTKARLALAKGTRVVIKEGLKLLGVSTPKRM